MHHIQWKFASIFLAAGSSVSSFLCRSCTGCPSTGCVTLRSIEWDCHNVNGAERLQVNSKTAWPGHRRGRKFLTKKKSFKMFVCFGWVTSFVCVLVRHSHYESRSMIVNNEQKKFVHKKVVCTPNTIFFKCSAEFFLSLHLVPGMDWLRKNDDGCREVCVRRAIHE